MLVTIYCRALLYSILLYRVLLSNHSLWIKNKLQSSKYIKIQSVESFIQHHGPSAWATPSKRGGKPMANQIWCQCEVYGQGIGLSTYQCDAELPHDITSHPAIKQYQQLAYVGWQVADTKIIQTGFLSWEHSNKCMTFPKWLTGQHLAVHEPLTHFTSVRKHVLEDSAQIPLWDTMICDTETHSIPWGNVKTWRTSQSRRGGTNPILRWSGHLSIEVILESTHVGKKTERKLCSEHFMVPGALNFHKKC